MLPVRQVQDQFRLRVVLGLALPPGYPVQVGRGANFIIAGASAVQIPVAQTTGPIQGGVGVFQEALGRAAVGMFAWVNLHQTDRKE